MSERVLRPKDKRKVSSLLTDSVLFGNDQEHATPKKVKKGGTIKKTGKRKEKEPETTHHHHDHYLSKAADSSGDEGALIIDDPDAYYHDDYDSEEERRKRQKEREAIQSKMEEGLKKKAKKKRNAHISKGYYEVPMDEHGQPIMPIVLGVTTIYSLGKIVYDRPKFHAKNYIWPVGFRSSREYCSMTNFESRCKYFSEIIDGGTEPRFVVTCYEDTENPISIEASTPSGAWAQVGQRINGLKFKANGKEVLTQLSGPEMFGFSFPTIAKLIQEMPGATECSLYQMQEFIPKNALLPTAGSKKGRRGKRNKEDDVEDENDDAEDDADDYEQEYTAKHANLTPSGGKKGKKKKKAKEEEVEEEEEEVEEDMDDYDNGTESDELSEDEPYHNNNNNNNNHGYQSPSSNGHGNHHVNGESLKTITKEAEDQRSISNKNNNNNNHTNNKWDQDGQETEQQNWTTE